MDIWVYNEDGQDWIFRVFMIGPDMIAYKDEGETFEGNKSSRKILPHFSRRGGGGSLYTLHAG